MLRTARTPSPPNRFRRPRVWTRPGRGMYVKINLWAGFYRARYRLNRNQILQENTRRKALDEIYKIYMLLHRSEKNVFELFSVIFAQILMKFYRNFADILENVEIL